MKKEEIEEYVKKVDDPDLATQPGMVHQVWEDGEITCQKCGDLLWQRLLHSFKCGHPVNRIKMPHNYNKYSYAFVTSEESEKISEMIFNMEVE